MSERGPVDGLYPRHALHGRKLRVLTTEDQLAREALAAETNHSLPGRRGVGCWNGYGKEGGCRNGSCATTKGRSNTANKPPVVTL
jgi:hypothetical protein